MKTTVYPRILVEGPTSLERTHWRVVLDRKPDSNGIPREVRIVELWDGSVDGMGQALWRRVNAGKSASMSDWILVAEAALDLALQQVKE